MPQDDTHLVELAKTGDQYAFAALVERYQRRVYTLALRMTNSAEDAADLSQEAFLNVWRGLSSFQGGSSFSTWVYRLTSNVCIDFLRREKRRRAASALSLDDETANLADTVPDRGPSPQESLERREAKQALERGLAQLSEEHRQVLALRELGGLSYVEIAAVLGLEEGTVKSRIARARLALRNFLRSDGNFLDAAASEPTKALEKR